MHPERPAQGSGPLRSGQAIATSPERWTELQRLVDGALDLPAHERRAYLDSACADAELRQEAARLLNACERADAEDGLFAQPAAAFAAPLLAEGAGDAAGRAEERAADLAAALRAGLAGRYQVERELGRGGMATVFLARDLRHERPVAVKVIEGGVARGGAERFLREIRLAARLTHPHVLGVHDSGECDGLLYYVMPYVEGETLRARLEREGALPLAEGVRLLRELADALAYAHGRGVIHRDLKPENVLLSAGHAVVADFGIARALAAEGDEDAQATGLTATGVALGTPAYMAPEQVLGDAVLDARADLYALGVLAYEVFTGTHPFGGRSRRELLAAHLTEMPVPVQKQRPGITPPLAGLVERLLAKNPADRPQSAQAVLRALDDVPAPAGGGRTRRRLIGVALGVALVGGAGYAAYHGVEPGKAPSVRADAVAGTSAAGLRSLAVLPFENTSGDRADDYFSDGMSDELAYALARLPGLSLAGRTSALAFKGKAVPAQEIGRSLGVGAIVSGTVRRAGARLRVTTQLVSTADGKVVWDSVFESRSSDVFAVQDEFTRAIVRALAPALRGRSGIEASDRRRGTSSEEAYDLYLKGRYYWQQRGAANIQRSIADFRQAIAADPQFARAHAGLAMAYAVLPVYVPDPRDTMPELVMASARRAVALDPTLGDAHLALAYALDLRLHFREALAQYRQGVALEPSSVTGHHWLGIALLNLGRTEDAVVELRHAAQLDPLAAIPASALTMGLLSARQFGEAETAARHSLAIDSTLHLAFYSLSLAQTFGGHADRAILTARRGLRLHPDQPDLHLALLLADAAAGRWAEAEQVRQRMQRPGGDPIQLARAEYVFGNREPLVRLFTSEAGLRAEIDEGGIIGCNPLFDPLWSDARFRASMNALGVETCRLARPWPIGTPPRS